MTAGLRSRRGFLRATWFALVSATPLWFSRGFSFTGARRDIWLAAGDVKDLLLSESAAVIGEAYLELTPGERDERSLARLLGLNGIPGMAGAALRSRIATDFESGDTVRLDGWVLARTEGRLYALAALLQS